MGKERRRATRVALEVPGALQVGGARATCLLRDISISGLSLHADLRFAEGKKARVVFSHPDHPRALALDGELVRRRVLGAATEWAIAFEGLPPEVKQLIETWVARQVARSGETALGAAAETVDRQTQAAAKQQAAAEDELAGLYRKAIESLGS